MDKTYQPANLERRHYERWEKANLFAPAGAGEPYCIVIPPPNVTGTLHMGHAFQDTIMDALTRYHRMSGRDTLWQPGTDHAGIATQMVVERLLNAEGQTRHDLGREAFVERVWEWKEQSGNQISKQLRRLGASLDWSRERFTMDAGLSAAVREVFVQLFDEGLIYRGKRLVNWDPVLHTALSDLEVLSTEEAGHLWRFRYPLVDSDDYLVVATTRPETMLGDTAVAVHPDDERYQHLVGKRLALPLTGRTIPIIADDYVDPEFGTGCVKITPAHDFNDYEIGTRHDLELINILDVDARLNERVPSDYQGLDRFEARKQVVGDLSELGLLDGIDEHRLMVPRGDRSGAVLEPFLTDQWYVKAAVLAEPAIEAVESGRVRFVPENWAKTYFEWMNNIQDWCISRQLWWGHRIPAWYDAQGNVYVAHSEAEARDKYRLAPEIALRQDEDVLDTWFSSALWPFSTMGWPEQTPELAKFYPTTVLVTGFDIIFFWVARMIMMGLKFMGDVPFREVYIHGLVRDHDGQKMSKSKGNVLDPTDIIDGVTLDTLLTKRTEGLMQPHLKQQIVAATRREFPAGIPEYGTDALRFTFAALATTGRDIRFDMGRVEGYRNFCNKLWNAAQFVLTNVPSLDEGAVELSLPDRWIQAKLRAVTEQVRQNMAVYRLDLAAQALYEFAWHEFCDWYLELTKPVLNDPDCPAALARGTRRSLAVTLEALLRLLHPLMPFITEELWLRIAPRLDMTESSIMLTRLPNADDYASDADALAQINWLKDFVVGIRQIRGEMDISPGRVLTALLVDSSSTDRDRLARLSIYLQRLARLETIQVIAADGEVPQGAATALLGEMRILVPLAGVIDLDAERQRLAKVEQRLNKDLAKCEAKLGNQQFRANAPPEIVAKEQERVNDLRQNLARISDQVARLKGLQ
jgi:valyl-tRNA synthetase